MNEKIEIEIFLEEYEALQANSMIRDMCGSYLNKTINEDEEYIVLELSKSNAEDLLGWVAGEVNHSKCSQEQELLNAVCDTIEASV